MTTLSVFQLLPEHVVRLIVDHFSCNSHLCYDDIDQDTSSEYDSMHMPLLSVCHNFRAFVFARLYRRQQLDIHGFKTHPGPNVYPWPAYHLAKELDVYLGLWSIYTGQALRLLSSASYEGCAFPLVRKISIFITADNHDSDHNWDGSVDDYLVDKYKAYHPDTAANIAAFVLRLKEMMPAISEVGMSHSDVVEKLLERRDTHSIDVVQRLFNIVETPMVLVYFSTGSARHLDLEPIGSLVRLVCHGPNGQDAFLPLIRCSAQTLQMLDLDVTDMPDISGLIRDPDSSEYVEYSWLQKLRIYMIHDTTALQKLIFNGAVPFPSLRHLNIDRICPFDDDVLFRGNSSSLESFSVALLPATVAMLQRYKVFTPTSHPKLQRVDIQLLLQETINMFSSAASYMQFVLSIAPKSSVRRIYDLIDFGEALQPALMLLGNHTTIQVLSILNVWLSIWDAFDLIKSLPLLSDLRAAATTLDELPQGIDMTELPEYVRSTYTLMGVRFRCWHFGYDTFDNYHELATCMLLLALACPNFDYAAVNHSNHKPFMKAVREKIAEPGFSKYAPRLQRLLFDGWKGCEVDNNSDKSSVVNSQ